ASAPRATQGGVAPALHRYARCADERITRPNTGTSLSSGGRRRQQGHHGGRRRHIEGREACGVSGRCAGELSQGARLRAALVEATSERSPVPRQNVAWL